MSLRWEVVLSQQAERDFQRILHWTGEQFGKAQVEIYRETLISALVALEFGPGVWGARQSRDLGPGISLLSVARGGRKGRHFVVFRALNPGSLEVLRILHDSMDLPRHLPEL